MNLKKVFLLQLSEPVCMGGEVISVAVIAVALLGEQGQKWCLAIVKSWQRHISPGSTLVESLQDHLNMEISALGQNKAGSRDIERERKREKKLQQCQKEEEYGEGEKEKEIVRGKSEAASSPIFSGRIHMASCFSISPLEPNLWNVHLVIRGKM